MAENSKIEWTDHTFNPWMGCTHVSEGCANCYAERDLTRYKRVGWGKSAPRVRTKSTWADPLKWEKQAVKSGVRLRVFCASLADWLDDHGSIDIAWRVGFLHLVYQTRNLDWMLLTKRPENWRKILTAVWEYEHGAGPFGAWLKAWLDGEPPANVIPGTSVEMSKWRDRIDDLRGIPASRRFLSMEPLLGDPGELNLNGISLVIVGGESGPKSRPMQPEWARSARDQCVAAGVAFFFKQWGEWAPDGGQMIRVGKKNAGRALDGQYWDQSPAPVTVDIPEGGE